MRDNGTLKFLKVDAEDIFQNELLVILYLWFFYNIPNVKYSRTLLVQHPLDMKSSIYEFDKKIKKNKTKNKIIMFIHYITHF